MRLTEAQRTALARCREASAGGTGGGATSYWLTHGTNLTTRQMTATLRGLERRGLVSDDKKTRRGGYWPYWRLTDAGRAAISAPA